MTSKNYVLSSTIDDTFAMLEHFAELPVFFFLGIITHMSDVFT